MLQCRDRSLYRASCIEYIIHQDHFPIVDDEVDFRDACLERFMTGPEVIAVEGDIEQTPRNCLSRCNYLNSFDNLFQEKCATRLNTYKHGIAEIIVMLDKLVHQPVQHEVEFLF